MVSSGEGSSTVMGWKRRSRAASLSMCLRYSSSVVAPITCISPRVQAGEIVAVLGASGSGKATLLRVITGLETCSAGRVWLAGANISATPVHRRGIGMVFQDNQLFPHLSVAENAAYALRVQGTAAPDRQRRVRAALELVGLAIFRRAVGQLSGGEAKRVAVARALVAAPQVLLLDEPVTGMDNALAARTARCKCACYMLWFYLGLQCCCSGACSRRRGNNWGFSRWIHRRSSRHADCCSSIREVTDRRKIHPRQPDGRGEHSQSR